MFEKDAEYYAFDEVKHKQEWYIKHPEHSIDCDYEDIKKHWGKGAEFGYNKANEWHYVKDGDLPKEDLRPRTLGYYLTASKHKSYKGFVFEVAYFTGVIFTKGGDILDNVIAWREIVLPKEGE